MLKGYAINKKRLEYLEKTGKLKVKQTIELLSMLCALK